jgi:Ca2+/Na+ antiporter
MVKINRINPGLERFLCVLEVLTLQGRLAVVLCVIFMLSLCYLYVIFMFTLCDELSD